MTEAAAQRSRIMRSVPARETTAELQLRRLLRGIGETGYRLHRRDLPGRPDVAFVGRRKAIFVNGCFWHGHDCHRGARIPMFNREYWTAKIARNVERDEETIAALARMGWSTLVVWECELRDPARVSEKLSTFLVAESDPQHTKPLGAARDG